LTLGAGAEPLATTAAAGDIRRMTGRDDKTALKCPLAITGRSVH